MEGIVEIFGSVVKEMSRDLKVRFASDSNGETFEEDENPRLRYIFGNAQYIKEQLDEYSCSDEVVKFPLVALFTPVKERRDSSDYYSKVSINVLLACSSSKEWNNEERLRNSFRYILRPMYDRLLEVLSEDSRLEVRYDGRIPHEYSENYSYGKYGAYTESGDEVSEPLDAINIRSMELVIKNKSCR